jgi:hypothetical protein
MVNQFHKNLKYLFYCPQEKVDYYEAFLRYSSSLIVAGPVTSEKFSYFLVQNQKEVQLSTFDYCNDHGNYAKLSIINSFNKSTMKWNQPLHIEEKFTNLSQCVLEEVNKLYVMKTDILRSTLHSSVAQLSKSKIIFTEPGAKDWINIFDESENGLIKIILVNMETNTYFMHHNEKMHGTYPYDFDKMMFIIPPGKLYTNYEKLYLPFDITIWWLLIITFSVAFSVIFLVNFMPHQIHHIFYGEKVSMPAFNVVSIFFGMGQTRLPRGSFARFILIMFIIFCLIFRTAYQGVQFEMLTKEMRRSPIETIQELIENNFTVKYKNSIFYDFNENISVSLFGDLDIE